MILDDVSQVIRAFADAAAATTEPDFYTSWVEVNDDDTAAVFVPGEDDGLLTGTAPVTIVGSPSGAGLQRQVKYINVFNRDSATRTITFEFFDGVATRLFVAVLLTDEHVEWEPGSTWHVYDAAGLMKAAALTPAAHAATHEDGGSDELELELQPTTELDTDLVLRPDGVGGVEWAAREFTKGGVFIDPANLIAGAEDAVIWRAPFDCTVTNVRGYRKGGSGATINARRNGSSEHLSSDLSLTSAATWTDGGAVQNTAYVAGDSLELRLKSHAGDPTYVTVQVDFTRP